MAIVLSTHPCPITESSNGPEKSNGSEILALGTVEFGSAEIGLVPEVGV